ncbi:HNH endonuclease [Neomegalonema perideroedes]|uniref:HNH endonuclease n=1 Tax=Neomegalonema perideroedes TaxID=217219 RepID=UPI0003813892|nr:HNH endonuclease [Neomegalonema perideroedes]
MDDLEISVEQWMNVLQDQGTTKPQMLEILRALYARPHHGAGVADLGAELGYPRGSSDRGKAAVSKTGRIAPMDQRRAAGVIGVVNGFGRALGKNHGIELLTSSGKRIYWALPFYSAPLPPEGGWPQGEEPTVEYGTDENGFFIWILWPELAEAMERLGLVGEASSDSIAQELDETPDPEAPEFVEGGRVRRMVNLYERDKDARAACVRHYGAKCQACEFDFRKAYGAHGEGFIHVHHLVPLSTIGEDYEVDPIKDLIPLCPNCHAMIHRGPEAPLTLSRLKQILAAAKASR